MAGLPPHPQPSPFGSLGVGEVEGHSAEVRDPISNDRETRRLEDAGAGFAAASAGRQPLPAGLARGTLGATGGRWQMPCAPGGASLRRVLTTQRRACLTARIPQASLLAAFRRFALVGEARLFLRAEPLRALRALKPRLLGS